MSLVSSRSASSFRLRHFLSESSCRRAFSSSSKRLDHYETLGVTQQASKAQIKSHFYKLSKAHHPDVSKDPNSAQIFTAASEAYTVLSDDRERRAYDRTLLHRSTSRSSSTSHSYAPRAPPTRGPRASYAWEHSSRARANAHRRSPRQGGHHPHQPNVNAGAGMGQAGQGKPYARPLYHDVLTGSRLRAEEEHRKMDKIRNESSVWRAMQLVGALALSVGLFGGWSRDG